METTIKKVIKFKQGKHNIKISSLIENKYVIEIDNTLPICINELYNYLIEEMKDDIVINIFDIQQVNRKLYLTLYQYDDIILDWQDYNLQLTFQMYIDLIIDTYL